MQELERLDAAENLSTGEVLEDLDVKIGVAMSETQKWIDNSFLLAQSIIDQSQSMGEIVTWSDMFRKFPYLKRFSREIAMYDFDN